MNSPTSQAPPRLPSHRNAGARGPGLPNLTTTFHGEVPPQSRFVAPGLPRNPRAAAQASFRYRVEVLLGYAGRSEGEQAERRLLVRVVYALFFGMAQLIVTGVLMAYGLTRQASTGPHAGQIEYTICRELGIVNLVWLARTVGACCLYMWSYKFRSTIDPYVSICPISRGAVYRILSTLATAVTTICTLLSVGFLGRDGRTCYRYAPHIFALTVILLTTVAVRYGLESFLWLYRSTRGHTASRAAPYLSQSEVDRIPLVLYIPPLDDPASPTTPTAHSPHSPRSMRSFSRFRQKKAHRFVLFRSRSRSRAPAPEEDDFDCGDADQGEVWDATWGPAALPYVRLEDNLATCSICREDFKGPPRTVEPRSDADGGFGAEAYEMTAEQPSSIVEVSVRVEPQAEVSGVPRADEGVAGVGGALMPLRLLSCGHAFHKDCIDPWLTGNAKWCPQLQGACLRPVADREAVGQLEKERRLGRLKKYNEVVIGFADVSSGFRL